MVKHVDRVGRMADTLEFVDLALPRERFSAGAARRSCDELAPSMVADGDPLVIRHCYVERRMVPLNLYLDRASPDELEAAVVDYGNAIRDLAARTSSRATCSGGTSASPATAASSSTTTTRSST